MSDSATPAALLHTDPNETALDTAYLSDHLRLDVTSDPAAVADRIGDDTDAVIVDATSLATPDCERVVDRIDARDAPVVLLTAADAGSEVLTLGVDAHLSAPVDAETVVRATERLRERDAADGEGDDGRSVAHAVGGSSVSTAPLYRRESRVFYGLWFLAALTYGLGDTVSTLLAVAGGPGVVEANPVVAAVLGNFGLPGFLGVKFAILLGLVWISVGGARSDDPVAYYWPPVVAALVGGALTGWNLWLLYAA